MGRQKWGWGRVEGGEKLGVAEVWRGTRGLVKWVLGIGGLRERDRETWYNGRVTADWGGVSEISYAAGKGSKKARCIGE